MPDYLLSVHHTEGEAMPDADEMRRRYREVGAFNDDLMANGQFVHAGGLMPPETAHCVDASRNAVSAGPRVKGDMHMGGFWVVQADDEASALELARRASEATGGPVEVRPFQTV